VSAALVIQYVMHIHLWTVLLDYIFPRYLKNSMIFRKKKLLNIKNMF